MDVLPKLQAPEQHLQMIHVWDHFDYTNDVEWFKTQGWPLLKVRHLSDITVEHCAHDLCSQGVAGFQLDKLIQDKYFNDTTLVVSPCNSPEQVPITFGNYAIRLYFDLYPTLIVWRRLRTCPTDDLAASQCHRERF